MKYVFTIIFITALSFANVDIVNTEEGLCVAWSRQGVITAVRNVDTSAEIEFSSDWEWISIGIDDRICTDVPSIIVGVSSEETKLIDSLYILSSADLQILSSREVIPDSILDPYFGEQLHQISVSRYSYDMRMLMNCLMATLPTSVYCLAFTSVSLTGSMNEIIFEEVKTYREDDWYLTNYYMDGPVGLLGQWMGSRSVGIYPYGFFHMIQSLSYDLPVDVGLESPLFNYTLYGDGTDDNTPPSSVALGSHGSMVIYLWNDVENNTFESWFSGDIEPSYTGEFTFPEPTHKPAAMTCHPYLPGMLLVWINNDDMTLHGRLWDGGWNDFDYILQEGITTVQDEDLAVCSVDDGYWVAWRESASFEPELLFVPRDSLTWISGGEINPVEQAMLISPNPFRSSVQIRTAGVSGEYHISIFDAVGRQVESAELQGESWTWNAEGFPAGIYTVFVETAEGTLTQRIVRLD